MDGRRCIHRALRVEELEPRIAPTWTMMVYLDGDNNLEGAGIDDFLEMASIGSTANVNIVVLMDRISGEDGRYDNWTGARRGLVNVGDVPDTGWGASLGEINMGDPATLTGFASWAMSTYVADDYGLVLWDHGGGFDGCCWDDTDGEDCLTMADLTTALSGIGHLDLIGFDACLMAMTEIAYQVRSEADVMVASEETEPGDGWEYQNFLNYLVASPSMAAGTLADYIIDAYEAHYDSSHDCTLSSIDLSQMGSAVSGLAGSLETFSDLMLSSATAADWSAVRTARNDAQAWADSTFRDLGDFMTLIEGSGAATAIRSAAGAVNTALSSAVLNAYAGSSVTGTGLSIYLPPFGGALSSVYNSDIQFVADTQWDEFLTALIQLQGDAYEVDDTPGQAGAISTDGSLQTHSIHVGADVDWVTFTLAGTADVTIETNGTSGDTEMWLYGPDSSITLIESDDNDGDGSFSRIVRSGVDALGAGVYYVKVNEYGSNDAISSYTISVQASGGGGGGADAYEVDDTAGQANIISTDGSPQTHSIHVETDVDWVVFTLTGTSDVTIETNGASGDTRMWLYGPNSSSTLIEYDDDDGDGNFSRIIRTGANALGPGVYYVKVDEYNNDETIAAYTLRVVATGGGGSGADAYEMDDTADLANVISTDGTPQTHSIHVRTDIDWVMFTLASTSDVTIATDGASGDTRMWLYGPDSSGTLIEYDDDDGNGLFSQIVRAGGNALGPGVYYVKVDEFGNNDTIASYTITVSASGGGGGGDIYEVDDTPAGAKPITTDGIPQTHSIHVGPDVDWVMFTLAGTSNVTIETDGASGDTRMWLYGPDSSSTLIEFDDDDGDGLFSRIVRSGANALGPGDYYVKVDEYDNNDVMADYTITVTTGGIVPLVLNSDNRSASFYDFDGDLIQIVFRGPGEARVATTNGLSPLDDPGQDIGYIGLVNTTDRSTLFIKDLDQKAALGTSNTMTAGLVETVGPGLMGAIKFLNKAGTVVDTEVNIDGSLKAFQVLGMADNLDLSVSGDVKTLLFKGEISNAAVAVGAAGKATTVKAMGGIRNSILNFDGGVEKLYLYGGLDGAAVTAGPDPDDGIMTMCLVKGNARDGIMGMYNGSSVSITGDVKTAAVRDGLLSGSSFEIDGDVLSKLLVTGSIDSDAATAVHVTGTTNLFQVSGGILGASSVALDGDVTQVKILGDSGLESLAAGARLTIGTVGTPADLGKMLLAKGDVNGVIDITGSAAPGDANSLIKIIGSLTGDLLAGLFGNVVITGDFAATAGIGRDNPGGTAVGVDNYLDVLGIFAGTLYPDNAIFFETD